MSFMHILLSLIVGGSNCKFLEKNSLGSLSYSENDIKTPLPFAVEILYIIFVIVKPFFLWLTVILFRSNLDEKITSKK